VPASSGYGEPVAKFFRLNEGVRVIGAATTDERFIPAETKPAKGDPPGPYLLAVTAQGQTLRTPLAPYRIASNKLGRRYMRLDEGDRVVLATVVTDQPSLFLASADGHVIHFPIKEINVLSGAGKGVMGIKLIGDDTCLGGAVIGKKGGSLQVVTSNDTPHDFKSDRYELVSRAGKGFEAIKRGGFVRVVPPPIELVDWEELEGKKSANGNGQQRTLFE